jgi:hypothetical protein
MGRTSTFTTSIAKQICDRLSTGEPLAEICRDEEMPAVRTVSDWKKSNAEFAADFARARDEGYDALAAQCIAIADDERHDWVLSQKGEITNDVAIARARLRVDTRMKLLAKWDPKRYGDKVELEHSGKVEVEVVIGGDVK